MAKNLINKKIYDGSVFFPIGSVSEQTGISTIILRAWERRYGLLKPRFTHKGHRLYSSQDVDRVKRVIVLLEQGIPIERVRDVLDSGGTSSPMLPRVLQNVQNDDIWQHYYSLFQRCIHDLDSRSLEQAFNEAVSLYSLELVAKNLLVPLYQQLQQQSNLLPSAKVDHSFLHEFLCAKLGSRYLLYNSRANGKRILIGGNAGFNAYIHIETLLFANILSQGGYQVSLLDTQTSMNYLPLILERTGFDALLLIESDDISEELLTLTEITCTALFVFNSLNEYSIALPKSLSIHCLPKEPSKALQFIEYILENVDGVYSKIDINSVKIPVEIVISELFNETAVNSVVDYYIDKISLLIGLNEKIKILNIESGSVRLTIELPVALANDLFKIYKRGELENFNITDLNILGDELAASIVHYKTMENKFDVFMCHNSEDKSLVKNIGIKLRSQGINPWLDEWALRPGLQWKKELEQQISNISSVAVFVGKSGIGPWQDMEIDAFIQQFAMRRSPVIPVLLKTVPNNITLPVFLQTMTWVDFRKKKPKPIDSLIWGVTGNKLS